jgi:hypothetical protein
MALQARHVRRFTGDEIVLGLAIALVCWGLLVLPFLLHLGWVG